MANTDIDKILRDIKRRKEQSGSPAGAAVKVIDKPEKPQPENPPVEKEEIQHSNISESGKQTLSDFINNSMPKDDDNDFDRHFDELDYVSKKSEDYIDEGFMEFFTTSVIVTKAPDRTEKPNIKRKKNGLFRRGYVTDSLSLNIEKLEEEENKRLKKQAKRRQKSDEKPAVDLPAQQENENPKKALFAKLKGNLRDEGEEQDKSVTDTAVNRPEIQSDITADEPVKVYTPKADSQSLNRILGDDKDPESLAKRILRQRKQAEKPAVVKTEDKVPTTEVVIKKKERPKATASVLGEDDGIISSIYTSVIESRAREALNTDQITGFIPEFDDEEDEPVSKVQPDPKAEETKEEIFEEYISKSEFFDKPDEESADIQSELMMFRGTLNMRMALGFIRGIILTYFNLSAGGGLPMPAFIRPAAQPMMFSLAAAVIYAVAFIGFLPTVISGFTSLKASPAPDSFISLGAVLAFVQLALMVALSGSVDVTKTTIFAPFICIALGFNAMGKKIATNTIIKNLTLANAPSGINAGYIVNDTDAVKRLARTLDEKVPKVLVSRKTGAITNFVNAGFSIHNSDYTARKTALFSYGVTAVCFVMGTVVSKSLVTGIFCGAGASALMIPLSATLVNSVPSALMQKTLEKVGALVNGWQGIDQLSKTTHVNFDAKHLFPHGTVILHGIKTFEKERIDLAILYAASVLIKECDTLKPVFMEVIDGKTDILPQVESCEYIELQGYVSWINNNRVIIGNRTLMEKYDVTMPPVSMENKFINQGRKPVYLAVGGKLFGMFVFSYRPDEIVKENLARLMDKGVCIMLSSKDFNIDPHLIETVYGVPNDYVSVLNRKEAALLSQFTDYADESECCVAHLDSLSSLVAGFRGAESAQSAEKVCSIIQTVNVVIGAVLALLFTYSQTITALPLTSILLLSFGFMGLAMLSAVAKKYE